MKTFRTYQDLSIAGAPPAFAQPLHVGRPNIPNREAFLRRVNEILDRSWLTNDGPMVQEFEAALARYLGVKHCVAMCNGTVAMEIAIRALDLRGEVITPSFTFVATAHALQWQEITPVFCDVDPATHNMDPACVERLITPRTTGIIGVHVWGRACAVDDLQTIADRHGLKLMFDAAHAFGCSHAGRMLGSFGHCEVFSFHATKFFHSFEGGAVATNDDALAAKLRLMRNFGFKGADTVIYIGTNGKMTEVCAAMGITGLEEIDQMIAVNRRHYERYAKGLEDVPGLRLVQYSGVDRTNYQYVVVEVGEAFGVSRDDLVAILRAENVLARRYFYPGCHEMQPYRSFFPHAGLLLPNTIALCKRVLLLPTGCAMDENAVQQVARLLQFVALHSEEVSERRGMMV
jgi:dTDP-4-amino-4,6-dideoxygalactose transaminase